MNGSVRNIAIVGSGNVAAYFADIFHHSGFTISQIISRNEAVGSKMAEKLHSVYHRVYDPAIQTELIILAVKDDAISEVADSLGNTGAIVCHCAGAVNIDLLNRFEHRAVLYPLQSIKSRPQVSDVPVLIETNVSEDFSLLMDLTEKCGFSAYKADSEKRLQYHLSAVFANNFSNAMLAVSERLSDKYGLDQKLLHPLIRQTYTNALNESARNAQTGPALRNDVETMAKHLNLLQEETDLQSLYKAISAYISQLK